MKQIIQKTCWFVFLAFLAGSCTKEPDQIGTSIIPPTDKLQYGIDTTILLDAYSIVEDSVRTDETSQNILGSYWDPIFGISTAGIYTQLSLPFVGHSFGNNPIIDSAILKLAIKGAYGDSTSLLTVNVYELLDTISYNSIYYSNNSIEHSTVPLTSKSFIARPYDSVYIDSVKYAPHLRIRLDQSAPDFIQKIFSTPSDALSQNTEFIQYLKGLYITAEDATMPGKGSLLYVNLESALTELILYYKNDESDSLSFSLVVNSATARFNHFDHYGYAHADPLFKQQVLYNDKTLGKERLYLQTMGGIKTVVKIPDLKGLVADGQKIAITEAKLIISNADANSIYSAPDNLVLFEEDTTGQVYFLSEQSIGTEYFGGIYNSNQQNYYFRIPRYIQDIFDGTRDSTRHLTLIASSPSVRGNRLVFGGTNPTNPSLYEKRLRLQIVYTFLP
ncbi:MAG TPA: DUF4270 domain-containing protein [Bacteroidales bacterium]|nr:DUF4270 domain-containing protein [Bacteroidales bacterium]OQC60241.1 MAG: hypothetical protein BWX51_01128 [Bacteroidetes bacterium ADurb.Bin012]MBP9588247.1 DUF4270 domain-containing protein [Bacteroidales bacterium]NMD15506.1 DUF4270 domain-containing protein [Bacteroidales bacterium]HNQ59402.1 DUF4270 domain-containing protein [Bacteroidales bacterium]